MSILLILIYLLFAPFFIEIDTHSNLYRVRFHRLASANLIIRETIFIEFKIAWWHREYNLLEQKRKKKKAITPKSEKKRKMSFRKILGKVKGILKSFEVKKFYISIDTGDMPLNGILYPWFYLLSRRTNRAMMINFHGENIVVLKLRNSFARVLWALIRS